VITGSIIVTLYFIDSIQPFVYFIENDHFHNTWQ